MDRRKFLRSSALGLVGVGFSSSLSFSAGSKKPNFVIIFADDMGYGDWNGAGHPTIHTPNLNRMAEEGVFMTQFYSAFSICSPSRAALLTGRYPIRTGVVRVFFPYDKIGLPQREIILPQLLKKKGYATACIGKWHLGHHKKYLPTNRGFDYYYGIPYSNDMDVAKRGDPPIPLMRNTKIIEQPCNQDTITKRYTQEAIKFIEENRDRPFFVYLPHTMPHVPLHASRAFRGKSKRGLYGDVIQEIDWSVGQVLDAIKRLKLEDNTIVIFTSDNGPWTTKNQRGGSAGLFHGAKGSTWEGGVREPCVAWAPGLLPQDVVISEVATTMDLFTTFAKMAGVDIPRDRPIDGKDILPVLQGKKKSPHKVLYYYHRDRLTAIRAGKYKLHFAKTTRAYHWVDCEKYELYDLEVDPSEKYDLAGKHPKIVARLTRMAQDFRDEISRRNENRKLLDVIFKKRKK